MKTALIPPIPDLERYATTSTHLLLAHLFQTRAWGSRYRRFYETRREVGDYLILDNGADEHGRGIYLPQLLKLAAEVKAQEVVLPDVQQNGAATISATTTALDWLLRDGEPLYRQAGSPALMIVPQGCSFNEWYSCLAVLLEQVRATMQVLNGPAPIVGVAKNHDDLIDGGLRRLLEVHVLSNADDAVAIHLLGWPRRLRTLREVALEFPWIRSVDSARPLMYAKAGRHCVDKRGLPSPYPLRDSDYFEDSIPRNFDAIARANIAFFEDCANPMRTR